MSQTEAHPASGAPAEHTPIRPAPASPVRTWGLRMMGLLLLVFLVLRFDTAELLRVLSQAEPGLVLLAAVATIPLIAVKTYRWQRLLAAQAVDYTLWPAFLAYFGSLFAGFLTPGRLGEFVKALHVRQTCRISLTQAFSSVLADRLFDLYTLLAVGLIALVSLSGQPLSTRIGALLSILVLVLPLAFLVNNRLFALAQRIAGYFGRLGDRTLGPQGWLTGVRNGLCSLTWRSALGAILLTIAAYAIFFGQCYLLALALHIPVGFLPVTYAVALGSLVTLLPISISGLGTREATMIAYLGMAGVAPAAALGFSLLVFATFYLGGGAMGAIAWWLQPAPLSALRTEPSPIENAPQSAGLNLPGSPVLEASEFPGSSRPQNTVIPDRNDGETSS